MSYSDEEMICARTAVYESPLSGAERARQLPALAEKASPDRRVFWEEMCAANALSLNGEPTAALAAIERMLQKYPQEKIGRLLYAFLLRQKGVVLGQKGDPDAEIAVYDKMIETFEKDKEPAIREQVARAMGNKGFVLGEKGDPDAAIAAYDKAIETFEKDKEPAIREQVARAMGNKGVVLGEKGDPDAAIAAYDKAIETFKENVEPAIRERVARAIVNKGVVLGEKGDSDAAIAAYDKVIETFEKDKEPAIRKQVAMAMVNKGVTLGQKGALDAAIAAFDEMIETFKENGEPAIRELVARAMFGKGFALEQKDDLDAATAVYDKVLSRFENDDSPYIREIVAWALHRKGDTQGAKQHLANTIDFYEKSLKDDKFWKGLREFRDYLEHNETPDGTSAGAAHRFSAEKEGKNGKIETLREMLNNQISELNKAGKIQATMTVSGNIWEINFTKAENMNELFALITLLGAKGAKEPKEQNASLVWRGALGAYDLKPSYFRTEKNSQNGLDDHYDRLQIAYRGIYVEGRNHRHDHGKSDRDEEWALTQHYGGKSPLLDWSFSPYVALFFTFSQPLPSGATEQQSKRMLYALNTGAVTQYSLEGKTTSSKDQTTLCKDNFNFILPSQIDNPRLIAQSGLLLKMETPEALEAILSRYKEEPDRFSLLKISLPENMRQPVLRQLNQMNINHRTLFPEKAGAGWYADMSLEVARYDPMLAVFKDIAP